ncbi:MAG: GIY-YIG nuclease family protein [Candidatus Moranbacteria bacterium]|nr:GIY-YIG nuclease family protein [Candidatus Moranbacteria bacterium]
MILGLKFNYYIIMFYVYLLKSLKDGNYYIGQTDNVERRFNQHNSGKSRSTKNRRPFMLLGYESYTTRNEARYREYQLKTTIEKKKFIEKILIDNKKKNEKND